MTHKIALVFKEQHKTECHHHYQHQYNGYVTKRKQQNESTIISILLMEGCVDPAASQH